MLIRLATVINRKSLGAIQVGTFSRVIGQLRAVLSEDTAQQETSLNKLSTVAVTVGASVLTADIIVVVHDWLNRTAAGDIRNITNVVMVITLVGVAVTVVVAMGLVLEMRWPAVVSVA